MKRLARTLILYTALGCIVSLCTTWLGIEIYCNSYSNTWFRFLPIGGGNPLDQRTTGWYLGPKNSVGDQWKIMGVFDPDGVIYQIRHESTHYGLQGIEREYKPGVIPEWTRVDPMITHEQERRYERVIEQLHGWPFFAWRGEARQDRSGYGTHYTTCYPGSKDTGLTAWRSLVIYPYGLVFPGVLYNAIFFGGVFFVVVQLVRHYTRRYIRWDRSNNNKCPNCAYNTRGLTVCPECGESLRSDATVSP